MSEVQMQLSVKMAIAYDEYLLLIGFHSITVPLTRIEFYRAYILNKTLSL
jgi:hypothetical protein